MSERERFEVHFASTKHKNRTDSARSVGNICFRFFNAQGKPVKSPLMRRMIGIDLIKLRAYRREVWVAGGVQKVQAILEALRGGLIDALITDQCIAESLSRAEH